jgi:hypothetical protein
MSSSTQTAPFTTLGETQWLGEAESRPLARRVCQAMVLLPLFSLILLPEYLQGVGDPETKSILYRETIGPLRMVDVVLLGIVAVHGVVWATSRRLRLYFPQTLTVPGLGFLIATGLAMGYGWMHGGTNLFFDWRALALGIGLYGVFAMWVQTPREAQWAMHLFAAYMALRIGLTYASFLSGGGDVIVGVRIPIFDGPTLSALVFTAVLALWMSDCATGTVRKLLWMGLSAAAYVLVLLCFRRTFWAELGIATALLLILVKHHRKRKLLLAGATVVAVATMLGPAFYERMRSMDFTTGESEFSQDNPDHVGEVLDAWQQVQRQPLLGIGLGRSYPTLRIQEWKEESVMVHNAPLHVWLKYGLMGLGCYVWFHFALFHWLRRRHRELGSEGQVLTGVALLFLVAQFAVSLGFTPWPYSSVQTTTLIAFLLAVAITGTSQCRFQPYPSSLHR